MTNPQSNPTPTETTEPTAPDYSDILPLADAVRTAGDAESIAWITLHDACRDHEDTAGAWIAARDQYVSTFPNGKRGQASKPGNTFKSRKSDVIKARKFHPSMSAASMVDQYGSVRGCANAARQADRAAIEPTEPTASTEPTATERLAAIDAAIRLATTAGVDVDQIRQTVDAALSA